MPTVLPRRPRAGPSIPEEHASSDEILPYNRPQGKPPEIPEDVTELDDVDLMHLLTGLTRWLDFASLKLSELQIIERRCEFAVKEEKARALVLNWGDNSGRDGRVTVAEAKRDASDEIHDINETLLNAYAQRKLLEVRVQAFERDAAAVSRELTRRLGSDAPRRRESRWGGS